MICKLLGKEIKRKRLENNWTQKQLSEFMNIKREQISKIESGDSNTTLRTLEKISNAFAIDISELFAFENESKITPIIKWAGGKTQLLTTIQKLLPKKYKKYYEPFFGGGALFFNIKPKQAHINDINSELMDLYSVFKDIKIFQKFKNKIDEHAKNHSEEYYFKIREMDRLPSFKTMHSWEKASRLLYLNKTCFNGLYRVNSKGEFNVPWNKKLELNFYDLNNFNELLKYFKNNDVTFSNTDFEKAVEHAQSGDFVYFDPPYDDLDDKEVFKSYNKEIFGKKEQERLRNLFVKLDKKGVNVMLSNNNTKFINELYKDYKINVVLARRNINSNGNKRGKIEEVIITNYGY